MAKRFDFERFPVLQTSRLILREISQTDAPDIFTIRGDYAVTRLNIGPAYQDQAEAARLIERMSLAYLNHEELRWGITLRERDTVIGMVGFNNWHRSDNRASVGFDLARSHWGQGIMTAALQAILQFGWDHMELNRIEADCSAENDASIRVMEKAGFQLEGHQREQYFDEGTYHDLLLWGLLRRDVLSA